MPNQQFSSVDQYISSFSPEIQDKLKAVRRTIQKVIPAAEELISYNIPAYKLEGRWIIYFSAYTNHLSIAMPPTEWAKVFAKQLASYKTSKSTIQFPNVQEIPLKLIEELVQFRLQEKEKIVPKAKTATTRSSK
jgi:uncharacterized protein YdhG (YjbR/CyaY superfamily)